VSRNRCAHRMAGTPEVYVTEVLPWLPSAGVAGFVIAVLYAILRGSLVPRRTVDARITELQQVVAEMLPLVRQGLENDKLTISLISGLKDAVDRMEPSTPNRRDGDRE
jgi:hypothetical protein